MLLRDFQADVEYRAFEAWQEPNVYVLMPVCPTGGGKTVLTSSVVQRFNTATCAIAHRDQLVSQMSLAFNRDNIQHAIIAPKKTQNEIIKLHHETHGYSRYRYNSDVRVAGVDSLRNFDKKDRWLSQVGLVVQDEGHHVLKVNKWGKAMALFPHARGFFPTAHALRADGNGLGRRASGLVDRLVLGPSCRDLISRGFLTDYDIFCPESDVDFTDVEISAETGDFVLPQVRAATHKSKHLVGDVVKEYLARTPGALGVTFAVDVDEAKKIAAAFAKKDVRAEVITHKTPIGVRASLMRQFRARDILQLISVDCLGEGVDVPAIEVVSLARRTASFQLLSQQIGRALRTMIEGMMWQGRSVWDMWGDLTDQQRLYFISISRKPRATVIDHVGNICYSAQWHGRPCSRQNYSLDNQSMSRRPRVGPESLRTCARCTKPYERFYWACPRCGYEPPIMGRSLPAHVDGDIVLLDPAALEAMRLEIDRVDGPPPATYGGATGVAIVGTHRKRQDAQYKLRHALTLWGGWRLHLGEDLRTAQKRFYLTFGVDSLSALTLNAGEAGQLMDKVYAQLADHGVTDASAPTLPPVPAGTMYVH